LAANSQQVIQVARSWIGVPFRHQGRSRAGVDCVGLIIGIARELDLPTGGIDRANYSRTPDGTLESEVAARGIATDEPVAGSVVVIRFNRTAQHVALCTGPTLVHAAESIKGGRVVEHGFRGRWLRMVVSCWKLPGVSYE
jgi:cell wall-associated NlpC family hydrolase